MGEVRVIISDSRIFCNSSCGLLALYTCHHLTQPAGLISLNRSTGSMFYVVMLLVPHCRVGPTLNKAELLNYFAHLALKNIWTVLSASS